MAIVASAAISGNVGVAIGNILGGIALQTVVLVALDAFGVRGRHPLAYRAAFLVLVLEAALVVAVLAVVIAGSQLPNTLIVLRLTPGSVLIAILWVAGLLLLKRARTKLPWQDSGEAPDKQQPPRGHSQQQNEKEATTKGTQHRRVSDHLRYRCPGHSRRRRRTGTQRRRHRRPHRPVRCPVRRHHPGRRHLTTRTVHRPRLGQARRLPTRHERHLRRQRFPARAVPHGHPAVRQSRPAQAQNTDIYLTALSVLLTLVYAAGLLFRPQRRIARMGIDSLIVLILYAVGVAGLFAVAG
jgi:cation:H+ antiporter